MKFLVALMTVVACSACVANPPSFHVEHRALFDVEQRVVLAELNLRQEDGAVVSFDFNAPTSRYSGFEGSGTVERQGRRVLWAPPPEGGQLRYVVEVDRNRGGSGWDARFTEDWALLRLDNVFPAAALRTRGVETSSASLILEGPEGWSMETRYGKVLGPIELPMDSGRLYVRPNGWMVAGVIGVRREEVGHTEFVIAAPVGHGMRRLDMLTFLRFTAPTFNEIVTPLPERVLIVGAEEGFWRGALSGPNSLYLHADRPIVSENATSTLLHELVHVAGRVDGDDWIVEGMAEYYALRVLRDSGGLSSARYDKALNDLLAWAQREGGGLKDPSKGADTACAAWVLAGLDEALPGGLKRWIDSRSKSLTGQALRAYAKARGVALRSCETN